MPSRSPRARSSGGTVVVFGAGPIGLLTAQVARAEGAAQVYVVDRLASRLAIAASLGLEPLEADGLVDVAATLKRRHGPEGVGVAFECTGSSAALQEAIRVVKRRGLVVAAGFYQGDALGLRLGEEFHHNGIRITCGQIGNIHPTHDWGSLRAGTVALCRSGAVAFGDLPADDRPDRGDRRSASTRSSDPTRSSRSPSPTTAMTSFGVSTWVWTSPLDDDRLRELAPRIAGWGFDLVELPIETSGGLGPGRGRGPAGRAGLGATVCAVMSGERDLTTGDRSVTGSTQAYLRGCIDAAAAVGASVVAGPIYCARRARWRQDEAERAATVARLVEALRTVADHAGASGVRLALEPLNRYETSLINTIDQAMDVVEAVDSPASACASTPST